MLHLILISWWEVFPLPDRPHYTAACTVFALFNSFYQSFKNEQCTQKRPKKKKSKNVLYSFLSTKICAWL